MARKFYELNYYVERFHLASWLWRMNSRIEEVSDVGLYEWNMPLVKEMTWKRGDAVPVGDYTFIDFPAAYRLEEYRNYWGYDGVFPSSQGYITMMKHLNREDGRDVNTLPYAEEWREKRKEFAKRFVGLISITENDYVDIVVKYTQRGGAYVESNGLVESTEFPIDRRTAYIVLKYKNLERLPFGETRLTITGKLCVVEQDGRKREVETRSFPLILRRVHGDEIPDVPSEEDREGLRFCKTDRTRTHEMPANAYRAVVAMTIRFGNGAAQRVVSQQYEYAVRGSQLRIGTGEEVQDFFENAREEWALSEAEERESIAIKSVRPLAVMEYQLSVYDQEDNVLKTQSVPPAYYLPGKQPKGYPYLTNGLVRSSYNDNFIIISALNQDIRRERLYELIGYTVGLDKFVEDNIVTTIYFQRKISNRRFGELGILRKGELSIEPKPAANGDSTTVIFQNQNYCPDWFAFAGEVEALSNYEHTLGEDSIREEHFKAKVKEKYTYKLNTGWLLSEEVELLWELIKSPVCFFKFQGEWIKVIPISEKPLSYDSTKHLYSYVVEFQRCEK